MFAPATRTITRRVADMSDRTNGAILSALLGAMMATLEIHPSFGPPEDLDLKTRQRRKV
jgi:hypothetical protein